MELFAHGGSFIYLVIRFRVSEPSEPDKPDLSTIHKARAPQFWANQMYVSPLSSGRASAQRLPVGDE